jgi:alkanesulfonate monooxygenase SsuD/methylene tetrahydromethanopterin reductase-like flavin-dependent oxidoreductase (luciferase family)
MGPRSIIGSNDQLVDEIGRYVEMGFDELIIPDFTLGAMAPERAERYVSLRTDVLSQLEQV